MNTDGSTDDTSMCECSNLSLELLHVRYRDLSGGNVNVEELDCQNIMETAVDATDPLFLLCNELKFWDDM